MTPAAFARRTILFAAVFLFSGCGSSTHFTTEGLIAPDVSCLSDPKSVGDAEKIDDIDEGNGCQVRNAWSVNSIAGVNFSRPAIVNCGVVAPLDQWISGTVQPA